MPNTFTDNRIVSAQEMSRLAAAIAGTYVFPAVSGGAVTSGSDMTPAVATINANTGLYVNGSQDTTGFVAADVTVTTADSTNPRRDWIWYDGAGACGVTAGTPAAAPVLPDLTAGRIGFYEVYVAANDTSIDAGDLIDRRANSVAQTVKVVGSNTTEQTRTTNTVGDMVTIAISPSITASQGIRITFSYRKSTGAAAAAGIGLKLNSTTEADASSSPIAVTSANNTAQDGMCVVEIPPRAATFLSGLLSRYHTRVSSSFAAEVAPVFANQALEAALITADITSIVLTGISGNALTTLGIKDVKVEAIG